MRLIDTSRKEETSMRHQSYLFTFRRQARLFSLQSCSLDGRRHPAKIMRAAASAHMRVKTTKDEEEMAHLLIRFARISFARSLCRRCFFTKSGKTRRNEKPECSATSFDLLAAPGRVVGVSGAAGLPSTISCAAFSSSSVMVTKAREPYVHDKSLYMETTIAPPCPGHAPALL